ncbi:hypothetical protein RchiOBHm_Chr5g0064791 [Rosa chinensis]|uniref:Uncharacterized protein n=1 Tax=Rosa chinensis TaxID=74649 RepID=A0A2P6QIQ6_ROSCH|nr:hypothetical protein RchiOBHm_Chr5g0064791 [Rosa chinensis]
MKKVAMDPESRIQVQFNSLGEPYGEGSVSLSSFLGPLVREHVPVILEDWRNLGDDLKVPLWEEVQARYILDEEWQKDVIFKSMGCLWRASKSRLVHQIQAAKNKQERLRLKPNNIPTLAIWKKFVKTKTSPTFKVCYFLS